MTPEKIAALPALLEQLRRTNERILRRYPELEPLYAEIAPRLPREHIVEDFVRHVLWGVPRWQGLDPRLSRLVEQARRDLKRGDSGGDTGPPSTAAPDP